MKKPRAFIVPGSDHYYKVVDENGIAIMTACCTRRAAARQGERAGYDIQPNEHYTPCQTEHDCPSGRKTNSLHSNAT